MSKYNTDELIDALKQMHWQTDRYHEWHQVVLEAVYAKLRAADALCEAIKVMGDLGLGDDPAFAALDKAIDEYEEAS